MRNGITVRDVMNREFVGVSESDSLEAAAELMTAEPAEAVVVLRGSKPIGSLSTATALAAMLEGDPTQSVGEVMEPPVPTVGPDAALSAAAQQLVGRETSQLLVVEDDEAVGLLTEQDVLAATEAVEASAVATPSTADETTQSTASEANGAVESEVSDTATGQSVQGICEGCGTLTPELSTENGQLVCPGCRAY